MRCLIFIPPRFSFRASLLDDELRQRHIRQRHARSVGRGQSVCAVTALASSHSLSLSLSLSSLLLSCLVSIVPGISRYGRYDRDDREEWEFPCGRRSSKGRGGEALKGYDENGPCRGTMGRLDVSRMHENVDDRQKKRTDDLVREQKCTRSARDGKCAPKRDGCV
ncbi:hypothetical protein GGR50DRAFT_668257 [Xylaria sp. CBS 124048]|nr:hypothetical protein GGR50DRAFT_668257 [Xylaria sp. CBS 124048]